MPISRSDFQGGGPEPIGAEPRGAEPSGAEPIGEEPIREEGFTILEILIAVAIRVIGLLGILALFPVAIDTAKRTIQETNAVLIAQSVEQAIREGLAFRKGHSKEKWTYFILEHDGLFGDVLPKDRLPREIIDAAFG